MLSGAAVESASSHPSVGGSCSLRGFRRRFLFERLGDVAPEEPDHEGENPDNDRKENEEKQVKLLRLNNRDQLLHSLVKVTPPPFSQNFAGDKGSEVVV